MNNVTEIVLYNLLTELKEMKSTSSLRDSSISIKSFEDYLDIGSSCCNCSCHKSALGSSLLGVELTNRGTKEASVVKLLNEQIGKPYVWGANGPNSFDCSGLTRYVYKQVYGVDLPRVSYDQAKEGKSVDKNSLKIGDLLFFDTMGKGRVSHVGVYVGDGEFIHASNPKDGVKKSKLSGFYIDTFKDARRIL